MDLGDMAGKAAGMLGENFDLGAKLEELGVDPSMLAGLDIEAVKSMLAEKGLDVSLLDGLDLEGMIAKLTGQA